jgi:hypothetical protein
MAEKKRKGGREREEKEETSCSNATREVSNDLSRRHVATFEGREKEKKQRKKEREKTAREARKYRK